MSTSSIHWADLEQEPYDSEEFVERLAWRALGHQQHQTSSSTTNNPFETNDANSVDTYSLDQGFDADQLHDTFLQAINELNSMHEKQKKKCQLLEQKCREEESNNRKRIAALIEKNRKTAAIYKSLDEKINSVATKVIHLGDQLESVNTPRSRDVEALKLMRHFDEFLYEEASLSSVFNDGSRLHEAADVILRLQMIAQELPKENFKQARDRIDAKYFEIEQKLLDEFAKSHRSNDPQRMKELALILSQFKRYNLCVDEFINQIQTRESRSKDVFKDVVPICNSSWKVIAVVFPNPQQVMSKFLLNIYHNKLKLHVQTVLSDKKDVEKYLVNLFRLYSQTVQLTGQLSVFSSNTVGTSSSDHGFLTSLTKAIFKNYLETYINVESSHLNDKCTHYLQGYYKGLGHQKAAAATTPLLQDIKRDIRGLIASKANINILETVSYGGETFLSEEVAINLLQLTRMAFRRAQVLSGDPKDVAGNSVEIFNILVSYLIHEHIDYALDLGLQGIPLPECKTVPELYFLDVVRQTNAIIHLFEKQFNDCLLPLVASTTKHADCLQKQKNELEKMEVKLDVGLDRTLSTLVGYVKHILTTEQKKTDFNPTSEQTALAASSPACLKVVKFVNNQTEKIRDCLDGRNVDLVLLELGIRLHRVIYDHLHSFTYGDHGVMPVICDVQEYRKCVAHFKVPAVIKLFDTLHAMCNLLFLPRENIKGAIQADDLNNLDPTILDNWIQLRSDYKANKLGTYRDAEFKNKLK